MAESILESLWALLQPREAEAKITGGPDEMAMLEAVKRRNARQRGQYLPDQYQRVIQAAEAHPETVTLVRSPGMMDDAADPDAAATAAYDRNRKIIWYDPGLPVRDVPNTLTHELVHFLNSQSARPLGTAAQHALIKQFLGTNEYQPAAFLKGYQPGALSPVEHDIWRSWLGGGQGDR
jgi:hypothetical protein